VNDGFKLEAIRDIETLPKTTLLPSEHNGGLHLY